MRGEESLQARLYKRFQEDPDQNALAFYARGEELRWQTFGELYTRARIRANYLKAHGVHAGDACIVVPENDDLSVVNLLAVIIVGARPLCAAPPIVRGQHSSLREILAYIIRKTRARTVLAGEHMQTLLEGIEASGNTSFIFGNPADSIEEPLEKLHFPKGGDVAAMQLTSGTTGFPKICVWRQSSVLRALDGMAEGMKLQPNDLSVNWTPLYHDMGLVNNFLFCMVNHIPLVMFSAFDFVKSPALWLQILSDSKATITWSPNFGFALAANSASEMSLEGVRLDGVRGFWNAAERIHLETIESFYRRFSPYGVRRSALKTNLGMAEMIGGATFSDPDAGIVTEDIEREPLFKQGVARPVNTKREPCDDAITTLSVGRPYPGLKVKITSTRGRELPDGTVGEIVFQGPAHMDGYLGNKYETDKAIKAYGLRTGDLGYQRNGEVFWMGRSRERITLHGKKYDPSDFEKPLLNIDGLRKGCFAVFGVQDDQLGTERLIVVAEKKNADNTSDSSLIRTIAGSISVSLGVKPNEVILVDQGTMTKTSSGKRRHRYYRELYESGKLSSVTS